MYQRTQKIARNSTERGKNQQVGVGDFILVTIPEQTHLSLSSPQICISFAKTAFLMFKFFSCV